MIHTFTNSKENAVAARDNSVTSSAMPSNLLSVNETRLGMNVSGNIIGPSDKSIEIDSVKIKTEHKPKNCRTIDCKNILRYFRLNTVTETLKMWWTCRLSTKRGITGYWTRTIENKKWYVFFLKFELLYHKQICCINVSNKRDCM